MSPAASAALLGILVLVSVYVVAVTDTIFELRVSGLRGYSRAWVLPTSRAALLLSQRRSVTERPDAQAWALAPALLGGLGAVALTAIPLAPGLEIADVDAGIVLFGAALVQVMVAVFLHGWAANSLFPLLGAFRMAALALSVSIPFSLVVITTALPAESLSVGQIIVSQEGAWNVVRQPLGLPIFLVTGMAFSFWGPLQLPDAGDLSGGTSAEVSGAALLAWRVSRAMILVAVAAMGAAVFLGGHLGSWLPGWLWMGLKTFALLLVMLWMGHCFARPRVENAVKLGWLVLLPVALVDVFVSGALTL